MDAPWFSRISLKYLARYFDAYYGPVNRQVFWNTLVMGLLTATGGTMLGFAFAYAVVRCSLPGKRFVHLLALVPIVSPPFAIALSTILLFGRNGLISHKLLGIEFPPGSNDIYGMDGLVFVQVITFFSVAYLIIRAMLERLDPSMEEAAHSLGAGKFHIFRTVTLPLLIPGIASAFLLLFVESLADLGNPLFIAGNVTVLSAQIFIAVAGEYDYQKASALAAVLLVPTVLIFLVQRYYVSRRSYVSVTGKPTGGHILVKEAWIRWPFIILTYFICALIVVLYTAVIYGSFATAWGVDYTPTLRWWQQALTRGVESVLDTTFLSAYATPIAALTGMVIAFLVVRKRFSGKEGFDFVSNLGGAVPGTILGIGFVLAFSTPPWVAVAVLYVLLAFFLVWTSVQAVRLRWLVLAIGTLAGIALALLYNLIADSMYYLIGGVYIALGLAMRLRLKQRGTGWMLLAMGAYLLGLQPDRVHRTADRRFQPVAAAGVLEQRGLPVFRLHQGLLPDPGADHRDHLCVYIAVGDREGPGAAARHLHRVPAGPDRCALLHGRADGADRHAVHHPGGLCRAQPARLGARGRRLPPADRSEHRGGVGDVGGRRAIHLPQDDAAADLAGAVGGPDFQLHPPYDQPVGGHFPGQRALAHRHRVDLERVGAGRRGHGVGLLNDHHRPGAHRHRHPLFHHAQAPRRPRRCGSEFGGVETRNQEIRDQDSDCPLPPIPDP